MSSGVCKLMVEGKKNTTFQFSVKRISNKMPEATFKLKLILNDTMLIAHTELLLQVING